MHANIDAACCEKMLPLSASRYGMGHGSEGMMCAPFKKQLLVGILRVNNDGRLSRA